jgi:tetratricopeptide (TPR) repeat protein
MRANLIASIVVGATIAASAAHAAPWEPKSKAARQLIRDGADAFDAGEYTRAASLFLQSWDVETAHLARWNAAQSYAAAGDWRRALYLFEKLLADSTIPRDQRPTIEARRELAAAFLAAQDLAHAQRWDAARAAYLAILEIEGIDARDRQHASSAIDKLAQSRADADAAKRTPEAPLPTTTTPPASISTAPPDAPTPPRDVPPPPRPSRFSDTTALVVLGVGAAALGIGAGLSWHAGNLDDQADDPLTAEPDRPGLRDQAASERTSSAIAFVAGGALVVAGAIKLAIPPSAPRPDLATVTPTDGGAMLVLGGRF